MTGLLDAAMADIAAANAALDAHTRAAQPARGIQLPDPGREPPAPDPGIDIGL